VPKNELGSRSNTASGAPLDVNLLRVSDVAEQSRNYEIRLSRLEDIESVKQLMNRYAMLCDSKYPVDEIMALFSPDFVMEFGDPVGDYSGEKVREFWYGASGINRQPMHYMISPIVTSTDDFKTARASIYLWEATTQLDSKGNEIPVWAAGVYDNSFRKIGGEWKIARIRLVFELLSPMEDGWVKTRLRDMGLMDDR